MGGAKDSDVGSNSLQGYKLGRWVLRGGGKGKPGWQEVLGAVVALNTGPGERAQPAASADIAGWWRSTLKLHRPAVHQHH